MKVEEFKDTIEKEGWEVACSYLSQYDDYTDWEKSKDLVDSAISSDMVDDEDDIKKIVDVILKFHIATYDTIQDFLEDSARRMSIDSLLGFIDWDKLENALGYDYRVLYSDQGEEVFIFEK